MIFVLGESVVLVTWEEERNAQKRKKDILDILEEKRTGQWIQVVLVFRNESVWLWSTWPADDFLNAPIPMSMWICL